MYNLAHDSSGFNSGLVNWYNKLIDKTNNELTIADVCKMIRQDVLKDIAINKAIEFFLSDPYDGEYSDGGLLEVLASLDIRSLDVSYINKLNIVLEDVKQDYTDFEWFDDETKNQYAQNIDILAKKLESI